MKKKIRFVALLALPVLWASLSGAQTKGDIALLQKKEDSLEVLSDKMVNARDGNDRYQASVQLIPGLVSALKIPYSFEFPFDSLQQVSIQYAPDSTFRIFTWAITVNNMNYRFYGALQMKTPDGSLKLFPFFDNSQFTHDLDTITSNKAWIGALYYHILETKHAGKTYYTLFGWHGFDFRSNQKLLDVLTFRGGKPVFGAPLFNFTHDSIPGKISNRFFLIYKRDGNASMNYDPDVQMIVYDHLTSLNGKPEEKDTLVPDGTYEGFKWEKGFWMHVPKVYHTISAKPPLPAPLEFKKNILDKKMEKKEQQQDSNM